jgi:hypothetical protein
MNRNHILIAHKHSLGCATVVYSYPVVPTAGFDLTVSIAWARTLMQPQTKFSVRVSNLWPHQWPLCSPAFDIRTSNSWRRQPASYGASILR